LAWITRYDPAVVGLDEITGLPVPSGSGAGLGTLPTDGFSVGDPLVAPTQ